MLYVIVTVIILILDQLSKFWINSSLALDATSPLIPGIVQLTNVQNRGAAFGILEDGRWFFVILTLAVSIAAIVVIRKNIIKGKLGRWMLVMVIAGGLGNCIDRLFNGYVTDMFQFQFMNFAIFNVADIFITIGGIIFCLHLLFHNEPEEEALPEKAPVRPMPKATERPVRADYLSQLKNPVVEGRKNIEAEIAAKTLEASPVRKTEGVVTDWNVPDFASSSEKTQERRPSPTPTPEFVAPFKSEPAPASKVISFEDFVKEPVKPAKKSDSDFNVDDIIAEFKDK